MVVEIACIVYRASAALSRAMLQGDMLRKMCSERPSIPFLQAIIDVPSRPFRPPIRVCVCVHDPTLSVGLWRELLCLSSCATLVGRERVAMPRSTEESWRTHQTVIIDADNRVQWFRR